MNIFFKKIVLFQNNTFLEFGGGCVWVGVGEAGANGDMGKRAK